MDNPVGLTRAPWEVFGHEVAAVLAPAVPPLVDEVLREVGAAVPVYEGVLEGNVRIGVEQALHGFLELVGGGPRAQLPAREVYVEFGRGELRAGRSLDALLHAYRVGAQAAWRGLARAGDRGGLDPRLLYALAEALFAYIDELSAASAEGYAYEQSLAAREQAEQRTRLLEALLREPPPSPDDLARLARAAAWELPERLAVLAFGGDEPSRIAARLPGNVLVARLDGLDWALVPDPSGPGRLAELRRALRRGRGALGPAVAVEATAESARRARLAYELATDGLVLADDHLLDLLLLRDRSLARDLARRRLAPLSGVRPAARERLLATLTAWLEEQGEVRPVAERLHVHPQTVRYRVGQLEDIFGRALTDPAQRLELALALRIAGAAG